MNKNWYVAAVGLGMLSMSSACSVQTASGGAESVESADESLTCSNPNGVNAWKAALAVACGQEMGRWMPSRDLRWGTTSDQLEVSAAGKKRCDDGVCFNVQELLNMQNSAANGMVVFPGGAKLSTSALHSSLKANWQTQLACEGDQSCPAEYHVLNLTGFKKGSCDTNYTFVATATDGKTPLHNPQLLANQLHFAGYTGGSDTNPYLAFQYTGSTVTIDPTVGLNEGDATTSGSCTAACTLVSSTSVSGDCCLCNGATKSFSRSRWSSGTYLCN